MVASPIASCCGPLSGDYAPALGAPPPSWVFGLLVGVTVSVDWLSHSYAACAPRAAGPLTVSASFVDADYLVAHDPLKTISRKAAGIQSYWPAPIGRSRWLDNGPT